jgi:hypothetical protein
MNNRNAKHSVVTTVTTVSAATAAIQRNLQILRMTLALTVLSFITFSITLTSSYWVIITYSTEIYNARQKIYMVRTTFGIIWECSLGRANKDSMYSKLYLLFSCC